MKILLILGLTGIATLIIWFLYLKEVKGLSPKEAIWVINDNIEKIGHFIYVKIEIYFLRKIRFAIYQNIEPYVEDVKALKICKYFKFVDTWEMDKDILEIRFKLIGISNEYKDALKELVVLLSNMLQDFYIERLGNLSYPFVYLTHIEEGRVVFWVAMNLYGNQKIQRRVEADSLREIPNTEELEDD